MTPFTVSPCSQSYWSSTAIVGVHVQAALPCLWKQKRMERGSWTILLYCIFKINYINYHAHFWLKGSKQMTGGVDENLKLFHGLTPRRPWDLQVGRVDSVFTLLPFNFLLAVCGWPLCGSVTPPLPAETRRTLTVCCLALPAKAGRWMLLWFPPALKFKAHLLYAAFTKVILLCLIDGFYMVEHVQTQKKKKTVTLQWAEAKK